MWDNHICASGSSLSNANIEESQMPNGHDTYQRLSSTDDPSFKEFYRIYANSIRVSEAKTEAQIAAMVDRTDYFVLLVKRPPAVVGFSVVYVPKDEPFCLIEYMAIDREYRNAGIGTNLFRNTVRTVHSERGDIPILLEVDSEREPSNDRISRKARKQFYRKRGCLQVDGLSYRLPLLDQGAPPKMDLMIYSSRPGISIRKTELELWLRAIYQKVYSCSSHDPRIDQMLTHITDPIRLV
jgi:ribosomal protein S18 acetylase RimI-like enzyme